MKRSACRNLPLGYDRSFPGYCHTAFDGGDSVYPPQIRRRLSVLVECACQSLDALSIEIMSFLFVMARLALESKIVMIERNIRIVYVLFGQRNNVMDYVALLTSADLAHSSVYPHTLCNICPSACLPRLAHVELFRVFFHGRPRPPDTSEGRKAQEECK